MDTSGYGGIASSTASGAAAGSVFGPWGTAIGAGVGLIGGVVSFYGKKKAAEQKRREVQEEVRRMRLQQAAVLGRATAAGAASGVEFESESLQKYLADMSAEFSRQSEWALKTGKVAASSMDNAALFGLGSDIGSTLFKYAQANNYWQKG